MCNANADASTLPVFAVEFSTFPSTKTLIFAPSYVPAREILARCLSEVVVPTALDPDPPVLTNIEKKLPFEYSPELYPVAPASVSPNRNPLLVSNAVVSKYRKYDS